MSVVVAKFGGTSLADASQFKKVKNIVTSSPDRKYIVPSAPGKRNSGDYKITDKLYELYDCIREKKDYSGAYAAILERYTEIRDSLGLTVKIETEIEAVLTNLLGGASREYAASRGEYLNGILLAEFLGYHFLDAADAIVFDARGKYNEVATMEKAGKLLSSYTHAVIPGFYGSMPNGSIATFSRGGSDITGAIISAAVSADLYENWTDVSGFLIADPRIVKDVKPIEKITYRELRELSYMGATVLHEDSIFPVYTAAIPINVKNTNHPEDPGTMIVPSIEGEDFEEITGIAGRKDFTIISIEKNGMNSELGFGRKVLSCIEKYGLSFEHMPSGIDTLCIILDSHRAQDVLGDLVDDIHRACAPDSVEVIGELALIATVGRGMKNSIGCAAKLFSALAKANINIRMIDQGSSELNIIIGVDNDNFNDAVIAIHNAFCK